MFKRTETPQICDFLLDWGIITIRKCESCGVIYGADHCPVCNKKKKVSIFQKEK